MLWAPFSRRPFQVLLFTERQQMRRMRTSILSRQPDVLLAQMVRTAEYVKDLDEVPHVLDIMDTLHAGAEREAERASFWKRPLLREEGRRLLRYEHRMPNYFDACSIISKQDRDLLPHPDRESVAIVPNGVDTSYFSTEAQMAPLPCENQSFDVAFCGNLGYAPNVVAAKFLADEVAIEFEKAFGRKLHLLICGAQPSSTVKALASPNVSVVGNVPDIRSAYAAAPVFVAPMLVNTGLQNKLLEAMALERACVTTERALSALGTQAGDSVMTAHDAPSFAAAIEGLLASDSNRIAKGQAARKLVLNHFSWKAATSTLVELLRQEASIH
jgi:glycosyltransferase involved in cell wall biosynthesis